MSLGVSGRVSSPQSADLRLHPADASRTPELRGTQVSLDFLYRNDGIRRRVEHHRTARPERQEPATGQAPGEQASSVVRTLTAQLADLRRRHREETAELREALEQAHGENLLLRRRLDAAGRTAGHREE